MLRIILAGSLALNSVMAVALSDVAYDVIEPPADVDASNILSNLSSDRYYDVYKDITNASVSFQRLKEQYLEDKNHFEEKGVTTPCKQAVCHNFISTKNECYAELLKRRRYGTYLKERYIPSFKK
jgi:hypothetical protein